MKRTHGFNCDRHSSNAISSVTIRFLLFAVPAIVELLVGAGIAQAQSAGQRDHRPVSKQEAPEPAIRRDSPPVLVSSEEDYLIGPRDVIEVHVEDAPELSGTFNISANGAFLMPYLGRIRAADKSPEELAKFIGDGLRGRYLKDPRVNVAVKQYNSRSFFIQGAVRGAGVYQIESRASLLKLIILAGGLAEHHGSTAFIIREMKDQPDQTGDVPPADQTEPASAGPRDRYEMIKVNINGLLKGHFDQNVALEPGDIVNIPPTDVFFVAGEVHAPGSFPLKPGTTLRQAVSLARGLTFAAAKGRGIVFREDLETGKREEIRVDIGEVMSGKKEDIALMANDIVIVPNSKLKSVGGAILSAFGATVVNRGPR